MVTTTIVTEHTQKEIKNGNTSLPKKHTEKKAGTQELSANVLQAGQDADGTRTGVRPPRQQLL